MTRHPTPQSTSSDPVGGAPEGCRVECRVASCEGRRPSAHSFSHDHEGCPIRRIKFGHRLCLLIEVKRPPILRCGNSRVDPLRSSLWLSNCAATNGCMPYSITSSARASTVGGILRSSALAVLRLTMEFELGRPASPEDRPAFPPLRIYRRTRRPGDRGPDAGSIAHQAA